MRAGPCGEVAGSGGMCVCGERGREATLRTNGAAEKNDPAAASGVRGRKDGDNLEQSPFAGVGQRNTGGQLPAGWTLVPLGQ